jgi:hypothetical protein
MDNILLNTIHSLEKRAARLEKEAVALRNELTRIAQELANPEAVVATDMIDGQSVSVTQKEVDEIRSRMNRPRSEAVLREIALAYKIASLNPVVDSESELRGLLEVIEAARNEAVLDGTAIDNEYEAALDD